MNFTRQQPSGHLSLSPLSFNTGDSLLELNDGLLSFSLGANKTQPSQSFKDALCESILDESNVFNQDETDKCISSHIFRLMGNVVGGGRDGILRRLVSLGFSEGMAEDIYWFQDNNKILKREHRLAVTRQQAVDYIRSLDIPNPEGWS